MKRAMCIYLPLWPVQRLRLGRPHLRSKPVALFDPEAPRGPKIVLYGPPERAGRAFGTQAVDVKPGMPVVEAVAIDRRLQLERYDPEADRQTLRRLSEWANQFSPLVGLEEGPAPSCLLLDITGCASHFGGESGLIRRVARELRLQGWNSRTAIADTIGAAWGLSHYGSSPRHLAPPGETRAELRPLPIQALRLPDDSTGRLNSLGIVTIGGLLDLPRSGLPARLGPQVLERLDQALGKVPEILETHQPATQIEAEIPFEYPTNQQDVLNYALELLTQRIHEQLRARRWGARRLECRLRLESAEITRVEVGLARPSGSLNHFRLLLHTRLEQVALTGMVTSMTLCVTSFSTLDDTQPSLLDDEEWSESLEISALIDMLSSRLGREAVTTPRLVADPQPEHACRLEAAVIAHFEHAENLLARASEGARWNRPMRLYPDPVPIETNLSARGEPPFQFRWNHVDYRILHSWGPERIETGWWRGQDVRRDYYTVETSEGARFWIYHCRDQARWFLHGCFD